MSNIEDKNKLAFVERHRYQPRFDERIAKLPIYFDEEIKLLKELAKEEKWNLATTSRSYSGNQEAPFLNSNLFYEYLDESLDPNIVSMLLEDLEHMPLHINNGEPWYRAISKWRMKVGK